MSQAAPSDRIQLLIAGYVLGDLSADEAQELTQLMAVNPAIAAEIDALQATSETAQDITEIAPPAHLRSRVIDASNDDRKDAINRVSHPLRFWQGTTAIAATLLLALTFNHLRLRNALQTARTEFTQVEPGQLESVTYLLTSPEAALAASASVVVNPDTLAAELTAQGLPPLLAEQVYAVWTLPNLNVPATTDAKGAILTGVFQVDEGGSGTANLTVPPVHRNPESVAKVAITVEDAALPQQHTGSVVLITQ